MATGLVQSNEAISGFGNPATITVACMLALSYGVQRTGALNFAANRIIQFAAGSELKLLSSILTTVGVLSAFITNTAAVALFLPLTLSVTRKRNLDASKFLMPMSFAAMFAGTCTLVGTSTNLLIAQLFRDHGGSDVGMFDFAPMGLIFFAAGMLYLLTVGRRLLIPRRTAESLTEDYQLRHFVTELILRPNSPLLGQTVEEAALSETFNIQAIEIIRGEERLLPTDDNARLQEGDIMLVQGQSDSFLETARHAVGVNLRALTVDDRFLEHENFVLVEAFVSLPVPA